MIPERVIDLSPVMTTFTDYYQKARTRLEAAIVKANNYFAEMPADIPLPTRVGWEGEGAVYASWPSVDLWIYEDYIEVSCYKADFHTKTLIDTPHHLWMEIARALAYAPEDDE